MRLIMRSSRLRVLLATLAGVCSVVLPVHSATALTVADGTCQLIGSMHLSNGEPADYPVRSFSGTFVMATTVAVCEGTPAGLGIFNAAGNYAGSAFAGAFDLFIPSPVGGTCNGVLNAVDGGAVLAGTLNVGGCTSSPSPGRGALSFTLEPNFLTLNTCGGGGTTTAPVVCDYFFQGSLTYENTV